MERTASNTPVGQRPGELIRLLFNRSAHSAGPMKREERRQKTEEREREERERERREHPHSNFGFGKCPSQKGGAMLFLRMLRFCA